MAPTRRALMALAAALPALAAGAGPGAQGLPTPEALLEGVADPVPRDAPIAQSYVVMIERGTSIEGLARAWAILKPDLSRARSQARVFELRLATEFDPAAVLDLLSHTKGVVRAEPNFTIEHVEGAPDPAASE
ncbi:hypothetical protein LNKW23_17290 [Paralimibaculum aggregatum]|uniref:Inhibitor I9 domain-containing protein n=1 Tax=Paralimibaculum aggregatum TaxID=3036245 RepID=A0ABQ6LGU7_9RHOB|nr:hypothetical protein [Limibaculum sp. NKW23]GMG82516.1 hypothetical protein LNKW23_17290 [Limibaculum sp. NKW23]